MATLSDLTEQLLLGALGDVDSTNQVIAALEASVTSSINGLTGNVVIEAGSNITIGTSDNNIVISATSSSFSNVFPTRTTTGNIVVNAITDFNIISTDITGNSFTVTLPAGTNGLSFRITQNGSSSNAGTQYTYVPNGSDTLDSSVTGIGGEIVFFDGVWYLFS